MKVQTYSASEYREAEAEFKRQNPSRGDYWCDAKLQPVLVVLAVVRDFVTISCKMKDLGDNKWTWDLSEPQIISRADLISRLEGCHVAGDHIWAVRAFDRGLRAAGVRLAKRWSTPIPRGEPRTEASSTSPFGMTEKEKEAMQYLVKFWNAYVSLPDTNGAELSRTICDAVHAAQGALAIRVAKRANPEMWG